MSTRSSHSKPDDFSQTGVNPQPVNGSPVNESTQAKDGQVGLNSQSADFDINQFRADQNFGLHVQAKKKAVVVPVERPNRQSWICIHPDRTWRMPIFVLEDKENRRTYLVEKEIAPDVTEDLTLKLLVAYTTRAGNPALWTIRLPDEGGRIDTYNESALAIVEEYAGQWIRVLCDQNERSYSVLTSPPVELPVPKWPDGGFEWMFRAAFKGRIIKTTEHPFLLGLRGRTGL